jgi:hypothetical protein
LATQPGSRTSPSALGPSWSNSRLRLPRDGCCGVRLPGLTRAVCRSAWNGLPGRRAAMERRGAGRPSPWLGPAPEASPAGVDGHCGEGAARGSGEAPRLHHPHKNDRDQPAVTARPLSRSTGRPRRRSPTSPSTPGPSPPCWQASAGRAGRGPARTRPPSGGAVHKRRRLPAEGCAGALVRGVVAQAFVLKTRPPSPHPLLEVLPRRSGM